MDRSSSTATTACGIHSTSASNSTKPQAFAANWTNSQTMVDRNHRQRYLRHIRVRMSLGESHLSLNLLSQLAIRPRRMKQKRLQRVQWMQHPDTTLSKHFTKIRLRQSQTQMGASRPQPSTSTIPRHHPSNVS